MATRQKILLLDDDQDLVDAYAELLGQIPSHPEVITCTSGSRALALLESESFSLLITDLMMPKMDGLQVLSVARRRFPRTRTVVLTAIQDEQFRARSYAMGADLFWQKPDSPDGIKLFQDCIESLLEHTPLTGFRGVQNKSLVDIIQLECLSQSSSTLNIVHGEEVGKIWILSGEVVDAETSVLTGRDAFREIFSWKSGNFEMLPPETNRIRTIQSPYQALLLDSAQAFDESQQFVDSAAVDPAVEKVSGLMALSRFKGVEFVVSLTPDQKIDSWGLENAEAMLKWAKETQQRLRELGESLEAGELTQVIGLGTQRKVALVERNGALLCVGFHRSFTAEQVRHSVKQIVTKWAS